MFSKTLSFIFVMIFSMKASAGVFIEPVAGYAMGSLEDKSKYDSTGLMYGGRGGFSTMGFVIGAEYLMGQLEWEASGGSKSDFDHTYISAYAGYSLPIMLSFRAGYVFSNKIKGSLVEYSGSGLSFGVGYSIAPFIKLNFDYKILESDKQKVINTGVETTLTGENIIKNNEMFFSLSVPWGF
ncbi:hypothetical protein OAK75_12505 [Bacteriovoracales bacterium]|nr:hypothetical protein [Bacteriovoracales bacterium]